MSGRGWYGGVVLMVAALGCGRLEFEVLTLDAAAPQLRPGVTTIAGGSTPGLQDGSGSAAQFQNPVNVAVGPDGNLYVADHDNDAIRVVTADGDVSTLLASHPDVLAPFGLLFAADGVLFVGTDFGKIVEIEIATGSVTVRAQGVGNARGLLELPGGRILFSSFTDNVIRILEPNDVITDLAGSGTGTFQDGVGGLASINKATDFVMRDDGVILLGDSANNRIRRVQLDGTVSTYAGSTDGKNDGDLATARFDGPGGLAIASDGTLYVADRFNDVIRRITPDGVVTTIAGDGTNGFVDAVDPLQASFSEVEGIDLSPDGRFLYIADGSGGLPDPYHRIRRLTL